MSIKMEQHGDVAVIALDDGKANAINPDWMQTMMATLDEAEQAAKAIVIQGRPGVFSGGFDLKWLAAADMGQLSGFLDIATTMFKRLYACPRPLLAACTGHAIAAGAFVLLACDTRIAARGEFRFGANETLNNMNLPVFAVELMKARLDGRVLTEAMVQSKMYDPEGAMAAGFVDQLEDADAVVSTALATAELLAQLPGDAYAYNKLILRQPTIDTMTQAIGSN
ncbi:MAG: crotonase/enoyl-CoA hydratase family protein [Pseudomonadota bacterium]